MVANQSTSLKHDFSSTDFVISAETVLVFEEAAKHFVKYEDDTVKIWASSRDWFQEEWGRDTFISLPGLLLARGCYEDARAVFLHFVEHEKNGLIPNRIRSGEILYNTADGSLWLIHALKAYVEVSDDWSFVAQLMPTVRNIISGYTVGTTFERGGNQHFIGMDQDGLIISPIQATWMDADPAGDGSRAITPRNGKCVEINALWYGALIFAVAAEQKVGSAVDTSTLQTRAEQVKKSFTEKFWNTENNCLYDVIEGDPHTGAVRPNQIFAISHGADLLSIDQQQRVLAVVKQDLLSPGGLRTLSPKDSMYRGYYDTSAPVSVKDLAYHQGTVWPWLIGPYCDALISVKLQQGETHETINKEVKNIIAPLVQFCLDSEYKSLPEVFSGDMPFEPGGTTSQAWSVAEVLRLIKHLA